MALETPPAGWCTDDLGREDEIYNYILSNHQIQIRIGGEPCYLLKPLASGSCIPQTTITSWDDTNPYTKILWQLDAGRVYNVNPNTGHPDLRWQTVQSWGTGGIAVWIDGDLATRVESSDQLEADNHYFVEEDENHKVSLLFRPGLDLSTHTVKYQYRTLCACVDWRQGSTTGQKQCQTCFGRGYEGGFTQYLCAADAAWGKPANTFLVRFPKALLDVKILAQGLVVEKSLRAWCLPPPYAPNVDDYDIVVRPLADNEGGLESVFYEVTDEQDSRIGHGTSNVWLHQDFRLTLLESTDVRCQFPIATA